MGHEMTIVAPSDRKAFQPVVADFDRVFMPFLVAREAERAAAFRRSVTVFAIASIFAAGLAWARPVGDMSVVIAALLAGGGLLIAVREIEKTRRAISIGLIGRVCDALGLGFSATGARPQSLDRLLEYGLIGPFNREKWEDEVRGRHGEADFSLVEADLKRVTGSGKSRRVRIIFRGAILAVRYPHAFAGVTLLQRDIGVLNRLVSPGQAFRQVSLAAPEFERAYEAWSTDQVEARTLLDPIVLERFQALERLFQGKNLRAAFLDGALVLIVDTGDWLNMGSMFKRFDDPERVGRILREFDLIFDVIDLVARPVARSLDGPISVDAVRMDG
ncbi:MAG: DUF3137 domain-containing protein [Alphaproteobacteria bacterium]|nr:DUF3137 domain-containing protein [Alphaproteobacteria bacterium]